MVNELIVKRMESARLPTSVGVFQLYIYQNNQDDKEHLAIVKGEVGGQTNVLVRLHSECYTGDVLGSQRCDCGEQLHRALELIESAGVGVVLYLRQEGRGIGLLEKLRAYNLQDLGYDTVEANLMLGHEADERDYTVTVRMLQDLEIKSVQLLTNNPEKIESLQRMGITVTQRVPIYGTITPENQHYIKTKIERMKHLPPENGVVSFALMTHIQQRLAQAASVRQRQGRPYITLSYAQTLDGSIALQPNKPFNISSPQAHVFTHQLRANHQAILVGLGTVLADNPRLTVRLVDGPSPQPIILDSHLRCPLDAELWHNPHRPWIMTSEQADASRQAKLEAQGARVFRLPLNAHKQVELKAMLYVLAELRIERLMVEGGARVITSFIQHRLVDQLMLTIAPMLLGGPRAINTLDINEAADVPHLTNLHYQMLENNLIIRGDMAWA